jgi:hypothetical protein
VKKASGLRPQASGRTESFSPEARGPRPEASDFGHGDVEASLVLVFPLFLAYELGALAVNRVNGADVVTRALYYAVGSRALYLLVHACVAAAFLLWIRRGARWSTLKLEVAAPVVLEAAIYALTLGALVTLLVDRLLGLGGAPGEVVAALGAGVHEEAVFRLALIGGTVSLLRGLPRTVVVPLAIAGSSVLFAFAHHWAGEPWSLHAFAFRCAAGAAFALIFWYRSFAHAVYAHVLYDLVVAFRG